MITGIIGRKLGMTQVFLEDGRVMPVTVIEAGPCSVTQKKGVQTDGYDAVQLGFDEAREGRTNKPMSGHFKKSGTQAFKVLREFRGDVSDMETGQKITVEMFAKGDKVDVVGTSKGKGFQGVMKRHNFVGGGATHGSMFHRAPGGIGSSAWPSRVWKNKRLPGHMGDARVTVKGLEVVDVRPQENVILVKGAVPGSPSGIVILNKA
ncbi:MAG: 50S ribosomal protein L3 [Nitrospirae bacterium]|nr:50S ribosomal protein L3 [Nitrospirota bacterium]